MTGKIITHIDGLEKARSFCAFQERCHKEVDDKLISWGLNEDERDYIISDLLRNNFLNEERFAIAFAGGKFRVKKWGKKKIIQKLKEKNISEYCIKKGLSEIDNEEYFKTMNYHIERKYASLKEKNLFLKKKKTAAFVYSKGFESNLIWESINDLFPS